MFLRFLIFLFWVNCLFADVCTPTDVLSVDYPIPNFVNQTNNLRRRHTLPFVAHGTPIIVKGTLLDSACQPIANAIIKMWHKNAFGFYAHKNQKEEECDDYFLGHGRALTNAFGDFYFITIMPGIDKTVVPGADVSYINLIVQHRNFPDFTTKIYLDGEDDNVNVAQRSIYQNKHIYSFDLVIPGKNIYLM